MTARTRQRASGAHADQTELDPQSCLHGRRVRKAGFGQKSGKPFAGYFCSDNRRDCAPVWATDQVLADALAAWLADDDGDARAANDDASPAALDVPPF